MSNEIEQIVLADTAANIAEEPPKRRGIFGWRRRSKLPEQPLTHCENCGTPLAGEFCSQCGQHAIDYRRSLFRVLLDALDSFLNWDTKFLHSLNVLLLHPWRLTNDFNAGRRARYVHPLRLYLIASIIFFLLARAINWETPASVDLTPQDRTELAASLAKLTGPESPLSPEQREQIEAARTKIADAQGALTDSERNELKKAFRTFVKSTVRKNITPEERVKMFLRTVDLTNVRKAFLSSLRSESVSAPCASAIFVRAASICSRCSGLSGDSGPVSLARLAASSVRSCGVRSTEAGVSQLMARARRKKMMLAMR